MRGRSSRRRIRRCRSRSRHAVEDVGAKVVPRHLAACRGLDALPGLAARSAVPADDLGKVRGVEAGSKRELLRRPVPVFANVLGELHAQNISFRRMFRQPLRCRVVSRVAKVRLNSMTYVSVMSDLPDARTTRSANLDLLIDEFLRAAEREGRKATRTDFAAECGISATQLSQFRIGYRQIGSKIARRIEEKLSQAARVARCPQRPPNLRGDPDRDEMGVPQRGPSRRSRRLLGVPRIPGPAL